MTLNSTPIKTAEFSKEIRTYILLYIAFFLIITIVGIPLLLIWFLGVGQAISKRYHNNLICTLTERHLEYKKGVLFKVEKTIPLENIQDLTFIENPLLKYLELRIIKIETAGSSNAQGADMKLIGIVNASEFKQQVLEQRELVMNGNRSSSSAGTSGDPETIDLLKDIKSLLTEIRDKE